jgi:hypothetical protein
MKNSIHYALLRSAPNLAGTKIKEMEAREILAFSFVIPDAGPGQNAHPAARKRDTDSEIDFEERYLKHQ